MPKKNSGLFEKNLFSLLIKTFKKKKEELEESNKARKEKSFYPFFFKRKKFRFQKKVHTSNEKKSYASMAIIWP